MIDFIIGAFFGIAVTVLVLVPVARIWVLEELAKVHAAIAHK